MHDVALYRKYRPESFDEVIGQDHIVKVLKGSISLNNISHAYLFSGSRGTGKTSVARIVARELNTSPSDIYEIDAASNRGIDDIRELREAVRTHPFDSQYKVYIIDEVHMLTKEAFNALLKTLEEPPAHVIFILATTELEKVPETIVSRCQTFVFKKPTSAVLKELAVSVAKDEGYTLPPESAELVALLGDGSFRDMHGILQKVLSFSKDKKISHDEVEMVVGAPSGNLVNEYIAAIAGGDMEKGFQALRNAEEQNIDMKLYAKLVLQKLRILLMLRFAPSMRKELEVAMTESDKQFAGEILKEKSSLISSKALSEVIQATQEMKHTSIASLPLELALVRLLDK